MPTAPQRSINARISMGITIFVLFIFLFGQATLFPLILNYNQTIFHTNWYIFVVIMTMLCYVFGMYLCVRMITDTYAFV
jgi:hypothetical protein